MSVCFGSREFEGQKFLCVRILYRITLSKKISIYVVLFVVVLGRTMDRSYASNHE